MLGHTWWAELCLPMGTHSVSRLWRLAHSTRKDTPTPWKHQKRVRERGGLRPKIFVYKQWPNKNLPQANFIFPQCKIFSPGRAGRGLKAGFSQLLRYLLLIAQPSCLYILRVGDQQ